MLAIPMQFDGIAQNAERKRVYWTRLSEVQMPQNDEI